MTMKNIPVTAVFGVIVAAQLALGMSVIILAMEEGSKAQPQTRKNYVSFGASMYSSIVPADTS